MLPADYVRKMYCQAAVRPTSWDYTSRAPKVLNSHSEVLRIASCTLGFSSTSCSVGSQPLAGLKSELGGRNAGPGATSRSLRLAAILMKVAALAPLCTRRRGVGEVQRWRGRYLSIVIAAVARSRGSCFTVGGARGAVCRSAAIIMHVSRLRLVQARPAYLLGCFLGLAIGPLLPHRWASPFDKRRQFALRSFRDLERFALIAAVAGARSLARPRQLSAGLACRGCTATSAEDHISCAE